MISLVFLIAAVILFILATIGVPASPRFNLLAAGLACMALASLLGTRAL
jgi:hypothetical protein